MEIKKISIAIALTVAATVAAIRGIDHLELNKLYCRSACQKPQISSVETVCSKDDLQSHTPCDTEEQTINRLLADQEKYSSLINRVIKQNARLYQKRCIDQLTDKQKTELGKQYLKSKIKTGYLNTSKQLREFLEGGEQTVRRW